MKNKKFLLTGGLLAAASALFYPKLRGNSKKEISRFDMTTNEVPGKLRNLRGKQYCEIFVAYRHFKKILVGIYNNLNRLPISQNEFHKFDPEVIKKEFNAAAVIKNGPRFWTLDGINGYETGQDQKFYNYEFDLVGRMEKSKAELKRDMEDRKLYTEQEIGRYTDWLYSKGKKVYELISGEGAIYTMQSASLEINSDQNIDELDTLSAKLKLPDGWTYRVKILDKDVCYEIRGKAYVIQDDFRNTYQRTG